MNNIETPPDASIGVPKGISDSLSIPLATLQVLADFIAAKRPKHERPPVCAVLSELVAACEGYAEARRQAEAARTEVPLPADFLKGAKSWFGRFRRPIAQVFDGSGVSEPVNVRGRDGHDNSGTPKGGAL